LNTGAEKKNEKSTLKSKPKFDDMHDDVVSKNKCPSEERKKKRSRRK
jgi:hypothetical protein